ncbi:MAG: hypothetical protein HY738_15360 [Bacteroidia bacterium]|nr:hypothetical protein [Bacteroidia bacterium]
MEHCKNQISKFNFGQRGYADETKEQQLTGIIGECTLLDLFNLPWVDGSIGFDGGADFVINLKVIDVKTMGRTTHVRPYYINNFVGLQRKYNTDAYIFCSLNKLTNVLSICGWLTKKELIEKAVFFPKGTERTRSDSTTFRTFTDLYEIKNSDLKNINSFEELKIQLENL